jgi:hypothetical protein
MNAYAVLNILILLFVHLPAYIYAREGTSASNLKSITKLLTTSEKPVVLANFTRIGQRNGNEISLRPRTIPEVFERALELKRGKPFEFRVDKWRKLLASKLFRGLSAHISKDDKGRAFIQISGTEVPAITFSPEVSAGLSGFDPDVSGGINYEDNNLLGLGQVTLILTMPYHLPTCTVLCIQ